MASDKPDSDSVSPAVLDNWQFRHLKYGFLKIIYKATGWRTVEEDDGVFIIRRGNDILVKAGSVTYSIINNSSVYTKSYYDYFIPLAYLYDKPRVLVIGVGGGTTFLQLNRLLGKNVELYGVDTSAKIVNFARKHFIGGIKANIEIADGAMFVSAKKDQFDLIILDAYRGTTTPKQFFEEKFIRDASMALKKDGILAINVILSSFEIRQYVRSLEKFFKVYELAATPFRLNVLLICSKQFDNKNIKDAIKNKMPRDKENKFLFDKYSKL